MTFEAFDKMLAATILPDIELDQAQKQKLFALMTVEQRVNQTINLTRNASDADFVTKNIIDSLACDLRDDEKTILDVGTGGGFPGLPLAIVYPRKSFVLLDATAKKIKAVEAIAEEVSIPNVQFVVGRAEELAKEKTYREKFDVVVSRAVAALAILDELCLPFVKVGGRFCAWKGSQYKEEIAAAKAGIKKLGADKITTNQKIILKNMASHVIIQCEKNHATPKSYPRNYGRIVKKPLA